MKILSEGLSALDKPARERVLRWANAKFLGKPAEKQSPARQKTATASAMSSASKSLLGKSLAKSMNIASKKSLLGGSKAASNSLLGGSKGGGKTLLEAGNNKSLARKQRSLPPANPAPQPVTKKVGTAGAPSAPKKSKLLIKQIRDLDLHPDEQQPPLQVRKRRILRM